MVFPGLGALALDEDDLLRSSPVSVPLLGQAVSIILAGYQDDPAPADYHAAVAAFLAADPSVLSAVAPAVFAYYQDTRDHLYDDEEFVSVAGPAEVWQHVTFPDEAQVMREAEDGPMSVSLECECAWEIEHGLQLVFRDGRITRVGMYDGHLTNADGLVYDGKRQVSPADLGF